MLTLYFQDDNISKVLLLTGYFGGYLMSYEKVLQAKRIIVGTKQTARSLKMDNISEVLVATDADPRLTSKVVQLANETNIPITYVDSMKKLGKTCGIKVGAAAVAIIY